MCYLWKWLKSLARHWVGYAGGSVIVVALSQWERFQGGNVPSHVYWSIAAFGILSSSFQSWRDEHMKWFDESGKNQKPELLLNVREYSVLPDTLTPSANFQVLVHISNARSCSTSITDVEFSITTTEGKVVSQKRQFLKTQVIAHAVHLRKRFAFRIHSEIKHLNLESAELTLTDGLGGLHRQRITITCATSKLPPRPRIALRPKWLSGSSEW